MALYGYMINDKANLKDGLLIHLSDDKSANSKHSGLINMISSTMDQLRNSEIHSKDGVIVILDCSITSIQCSHDKP